MVDRNIEYKSKEIVEFYKSNRSSWEELYSSEKWVFEKISRSNKTLGDVLDVGCACGGLGIALSERFKLNSYTGIDINKDTIDWANKEQKLPTKTVFIADDIVESTLDRRYDTVISLSCADWNIKTRKIIEACWKRVKNEGFFIISLRLTPEKGINDIAKSYQYINFSGTETEPEIANYVVFNFKEAVHMIKELSPSPDTIGAYGYWGIPSSTACTPFKRIVFSVFYIKKGISKTREDIKTEFNLPI